MLSNKRILISPLNWGLGHATRCIPIIRLLIKKNATVIIAADGRPLELLKQEFPDLEFQKLNYRYFLLLDSYFYKIKTPSKFQLNLDGVIKFRLPFGVWVSSLQILHF